MNLKDIKMRKIFVLISVFALVLVFHGTSLNAQDMVYYKQIIKELTSAKYQDADTLKAVRTRLGNIWKRSLPKLVPMK